MPQLQSITMVDRAATPVTHTFTPSGIDRNGVAKVTEYTGVPLAEPSLTLSRAENAQTQKVKNRLVFRFPVVQTETINGISVPKIVREIIADLTFTFHKSSSEQERNDAVGMFYSAFVTTKPLVNDLLVKNQAIY
jgi:hypothetical protein